MNRSRPHAPATGSLDAWADRLSRHGSRITAPRLAILREIAQRNEPFTAEELLEQLEGTGIGRATVFRTVDLLAEHEILHRIYQGTRNLYATCPPGHHHHLVCRMCGNTVSVDQCGLEAEMQRLADATGFTVEGHHLEFQGRCAQCRTS